MSNNKFVTHMLKDFTDKYGRKFMEFFIYESIYVEYLSAADMFKLQRRLDDFLLPEQSNFTRDFKRYSDLYESKVDSINSTIVDVKTFFIESKVDKSIDEISEKTYAMTLFSFICFRTQCSKRNFNDNQIEKYREIFSCELNNITNDARWYNGSIAKSIIWSIELFRLRLFLEDISDNTYNFTHILDWFDIFEFRIVPVALKSVREFFCKNISLNDSFDAKDIIKLLCDSRSDYPFSERLGVKGQSNKKALWNIRKNLLPQKQAYSDVNLIEDGEIFNNIQKLIRKRAGVDNTPLETREKILVYTSERNRLRRGINPNGEPYIYSLRTDVDLGLNDAECIDVCINLFKILVQDTAIDNFENIISVIGVHHLIHHELLEEEKDDFTHLHLLSQKEELENVYNNYQKQVLEKIFNTYTDDKALIMEIGLSDDYNDELLAEMIMIGSRYLKKNTSDNILKKIFELELSPHDDERNSFINQAWNSLDVEGRLISCLHANDVGLLERINCTDEKYMSSEEKQFAKMMGDYWITELVKIHNGLSI